MATKVYYGATVELENTNLEAILDIRGAKTIVSRGLAQDLKWEVETSVKSQSFKAT